MGGNPVVFPVPERFAGPTIVGPKPHDLRGAGFRHRFRSWSDGGDVTHAFEVPQDTDSTLTLTLDTEYRLVTRAWAASHGNVIDTTPSSADGFYPEGTEVRLRAVAAPNAKFLGWNGAVSGRDPTATVVMDDGQLAEAVFALDDVTELQPEVPVEVSLHGLRWDETVSDFRRYYIQPPAGASHIEVEFRTRAVAPGDAGLFVVDTHIWPNRVHQETADRVLRAGDIATITISRPPKRWPAAYFILVRAPEADGGSPMLDGTLVVKIGGRTGNRSPVAVGTLAPLTVGSGEPAVPVEVAAAFRDPDGDLLTYTAASSAPGVAAVSTAGSTVAVAPVGVGTAVVTVTATDPDGLSATQQFAVTVATRTAFTDHPIRPGVTPIRAVHFIELRARIDALRARSRLPAFRWTDPALVAGVTPVRRVHLTELRSALDAVYDAAGRLRPAYADARAEAGMTRTTPIKAIHIMELRAAVLRVE